MKSLKRLLDETYLSQFEPLNDQLTSGVGVGLGLVVFSGVVGNSGYDDNSV